MATGAVGLESSLDLGGTTSFFQEGDGEVGEKEAKLRLAGRAGFNCNFVTTSQGSSKISIQKLYILGLFLEHV